MELSVITINLNNKIGLEKTINSVINQTYTNYEYIVIDGNSFDGSKEVIKNFSDKINYCVSEVDNGIYNAMNKGIQKASGRYLLFLHSADCLINNNILFEIFRADNCEDILYGDISYYEPSWKIYFTTHLPEKLDLFFFYKQSLWHQATFIKRSLFDRIGLYNETNKFISDWEFFMDAIIFNQASYRKIDLAITLYDMYNGISIIRREDSENEKIRVLKSKITRPIFELLERLDNVNSELQDIYKSDSYKIQRWLNKHPVFLKILMSFPRIRFPEKRN